MSDFWFGLLCVFLSIMVIFPDAAGEWFAQAEKAYHAEMEEPR